MASPFGRQVNLADLANSLKPKSPWVEPRRASNTLLNWETDDELYVMGPIGDRLLEMVRDGTASSKEPPEPEVPLDKFPTVFGLERRQRCEVRHPGTTSFCCDCKRYDPRLELPLALFNKLEITRDLQVSSRTLLEDMEIPECWPGIAWYDFEAEIEEHTVPGVRVPCAMGGTSLRWASEMAEQKKREAAKQQVLNCRMRGHFFFRYRVRREKRIYEAQRAGFRKESAMAVLDGIEYEANITLLPELLRWCEEYRSTKLGLVSELKRHEVEAKAEKAVRAGADPGDVAMLAAAAASAVPTSELHRIPLPRIICRCGHAMAWHARPPESLTRAQPAVETEELPDAYTGADFNMAEAEKEKKAANRAAAVGSAPSPAASRTRLSPSASAPQFQKSCAGWRAGNADGRTVCASLDDTGQLVLSEARSDTLTATNFKELSWKGASKKPLLGVRAGMALGAFTHSDFGRGQTQAGEEATDGPSEESPVAKPKPFGERKYRVPEEENVTLRGRKLVSTGELVIGGGSPASR